MARRLVVFLIPTGIIPLRELDVGTRIRSLGRRVACHCLSVLALIVRSIAVKISPVDTQRALPCRHCSQSSPNSVARHPTQGARSTSGWWCVEFLAKLTPRPSDSANNLLDSGLSRYLND